jgi:hypothetical protein
VKHIFSSQAQRDSENDCSQRREQFACNWAELDKWARRSLLSETFGRECRDNIGGLGRSDEEAKYLAAFLFRLEIRRANASWTDTQRFFDGVSSWEAESTKHCGDISKRRPRHGQQNQAESLESQGLRRTIEQSFDISRSNLSFKGCSNDELSFPA